MTFSSDPILEELARALEGLGLQHASSLDEARTGPVFLVERHLRFARHFDLKMDLLIHDPTLGTLGLVQRLVKKESKLAEEVQHRIDQATYVRHLLLTAADLGGRLPLTVELVLLATNEPASLRQIGQALDRVTRETRFLEAIGVNLLLPAATGKKFPENTLRRTFPWLLQATAAWYASRASATSDGPAQRLAAIDLENYRLTRRRRLTLERAPVHLIFGRNGSGKSSLVEALELVVTGKVERLPGDADYTQVIRNRSAAEPARVRLCFGDGKPESAETLFEVEAAGVSAPLKSDLRATAFRLDQTVMDRLTRFGDAQRAEVLLRSFFAEESKEYLVFQRAREDAEKALGDLPPALREHLPPSRPGGEGPEAEDVLHRLSWLADGQNQLPPEIAVACLPLPLATMTTLGARLPELAKLVQPAAAWSRESPTVDGAAAALGRIDGSLETLRGELSETLKTLGAVRSGLLQVAGWQASGGAGAGEDFLADLNEWLRRCVLASLAEQHCQLLETLTAAREAGWSPEPGTVGPFGEPPMDPAGLAALRKQATDWARERKELEQRVTTTAAASEVGKAPVTADLPKHGQRRQMDTASPWLFPPSTDPSRPQLLGQALEQAFTSRPPQPVPVGDVTVGSPDWAKPLLDRLDRLEAACGALDKTKQSGAGIFQALSDVRAKYEALKTAGTEVGQSLLRQLRKVVEALNELMALFTPARWTYEDIDLSYRIGPDGREEMVFQIGDRVQAALRLNTAQLNLFTVSLFLLCALRTGNPLRLLILDDPLQNMDELTVTTLARGLAKASRLWQKPWQLLLFFHGQEDRDRFLREMPLAVYELPWLSTGQGTAPAEPILEIPATKPLVSWDLQTLHEIAEVLE